MKEKHSNTIPPLPDVEGIARIHNSTTSESRSNSSSSSLVTHFCSKPKNVSKIPDKPLAVSSKAGLNPSRSRSKASKENDFPRATSRKLQHSNSLQQSGKTTPTSKPVSRSQLSSHISNYLKKSSSGTQGFRVNSKDSKHLNNKNGSNIPILKGNVKRTPLGSVKTDSASISSSANVDPDAVESDSFSANSGEKTPPIEASVSPDIQYGTACKGLVASAATPVCYGAGHLLSGIRDKRKCRPRGLLIIGEEETDLSAFRKITTTEGDSTENADKIFPKSRPSFVPPPAEASMRWLLSPNGEVDEVQKSYGGRTSSPTLKNSCQVLSGFASERFSSFQGFSGSSDGDGDGDFLSPSSQTLGLDEAGCFQMLENHRSSSTGKKTSFSSSSLSCGNVVQTPTSDLSSEKAVCCADADSNQRKKLDDLKLDLDADIPGEASISPRIQMPLLNHTDYHPSLDQKQHCNKLEACASWVSDSTLASMSLSRMRISWREGLLASQTFNTEDELDCYICLSDEKNDCDKANMWPTSSPPTGLDCVAIEKQKPFGGSDLISTSLLKLDSSSVEKGKETSLQAGLLDVSAESICIDGGSLAASGDSDWTRSYRTDVFQV